MLHIVTGGSGSGKSAYAEELICRYRKSEKVVPVPAFTAKDSDIGELIYIATMKPRGEETRQKIKRHRAMRDNKGFSTIECCAGLCLLTETGGPLFLAPSAVARRKPFILLECMSNLAANELYGTKDGERRAAERILKGIDNLYNACHSLVIVTNEVCRELPCESREMDRYKQILSKINEELTARADRVTEVVYGIPRLVKEDRRDVHGGLGDLQLHSAFAPRMCTDTMKIGVKHTDRKEVTGMKMVVGGAYQGKRRYAEAVYGSLAWADGAACPFEELYTCEGINHFETYVRRLMQAQKSLEGLAEALVEQNPGIVIVTSEIGGGLVPVNAFDREYREQTGRLCTRLAALSERVDEVVCGIGTPIKDKKAWGEAGPGGREPWGETQSGGRESWGDTQSGGREPWGETQSGGRKSCGETQSQERGAHKGLVKVELEEVLPADIEARSFEIITKELGSIGLDPSTAPIVKRCIHTSADFSYAQNLVFSPNVVEKALQALREGANIVTDTQMGKAGINKKTLEKYGGRVLCFMSDEDVARSAKEQGTTRAVACMDKASALGENFIFAVGNAPTALVRLYELVRSGRLNPRLVIAVPVGFVNVVASKELILTLEDTPCIVAKGRKGGSNIAACICNALIYMLDKEGQ